MATNDDEGTGKIDIKALQIKLFTGPRGTTVTSLLPGRVPVYPSEKQPVVKLLTPHPQHPDTHLLHVQTYGEEHVLSSMCKRRPKKASGARPPSREFIRRLGSNSDDNDIIFDVGVEISNPNAPRRVENEDVSKEHVITIRTPSSLVHPPAVKCTDENEAVIESVNTNPEYRMPNTTQGQRLRGGTNDNDKGIGKRFHSFTGVQVSRSSEQTGIVRSQTLSQTQHGRDTIGNNNWVIERKGDKRVPPSVTPKPSSGHVLKNRTREASTPPSNRGNNTYDSRNVPQKEVAKPSQLETGRETGKMLLQGKAGRRLPDKPPVEEVDKSSIKTTGVQLKLKGPTENEQSVNLRIVSNKSEVNTVLKTGIPQTHVLRPVNQKNNVKNDSDSSIKEPDELASKFQKFQKKNNEMTSSVEGSPSRRVEIIPVKKYQQIETSNYFNYKKSNEQCDAKQDVDNENEVSPSDLYQTRVDSLKSSQKRDKGKTNVTYVPYAGSSENVYMNMNPFTGIPKRTKNESEASKGPQSHVARMRASIITRTDSKSSIPKASYR